MASYDEYLAHLLQLIKPKAKTDAPLSADSELVTELGLASLDVMEMIEQVEDEFDLMFPLNSLPDIRTIGDLARQLAALDEAQ